MLVPQLHGTPIGPRLLKETALATDVSIAVAWVRASGVRHFSEHFTALLARGGELRCVVGLDCDNTSVEGLRDLLAIAQTAPARARIMVRHNEAGLIFHPKLYVFNTADECRVYVGSNNMTESGLFVNEEVSGLIEGPRDGPLATSVSDYFDKICDASDGFARVLTGVLIDQLQGGGYIAAEARLSGKMANRVRKTGHPGQPLFAKRAPFRGFKRIEASPGEPSLEPAKDQPPGDWKRIFLRVRLARKSASSGQAQIPVPVVQELRRRLPVGAGSGSLNVTVGSVTSGRMIAPAMTGSKKTPNTYKFEMPTPTGEPLLVLDVIGTKIIAETLDSATPKGKAVYDFLLAGLADDPPTTISTRSNLKASTLYRFD